MSDDTAPPVLALKDRLRIERERLGLSQESFGRLGGVSKITQWGYESGNHWPSMEYLETLRTTSDVDVAFLATGQRGVIQLGVSPMGEIRQLTEGDLRILDALTACNNEVQIALIVLLPRIIGLLGQPKE